MAFLTDRKRAAGLGSAKNGTEHHWMMTVTGAAMLPLVIFFIFTFGSALGSDYNEARAFYSHPIPAGIALLTVLVGFHHFNGGVRSVIEDYTGGMVRKVLIIATTCLSYGAAAFAALSIISVAL